VFKFVADQNLHDANVRGLKRKCPELDIVLVRDLDLASAEDPDILEWAAEEGRILLTHDRQTMINHAKQRLQSGLRMPGLFVIKTPPDIGSVVEDLMIITEVTNPEEWEGKTEYLPY